MPSISGKFKSWGELPETLKLRWSPIREIVTSCFQKGLVIHVLPESVSDVSELGYPWGGPAVYVRWTKHLAMTVPVAYGLKTSGYWPFAGDVHELGHAVRFLLIRGLELWAKIRPLFNEAKTKGLFLDHYSSTNIEEFYAQAFEAFWTKDAEKTDLPKEWQIDSGRGKLKSKHPALFDYMLKSMTRLRGSVDEYIRV